MSQVVFSTKKHKPEEERGWVHLINLSSEVPGEHENHHVTRQRLQRHVQGLIEPNRVGPDQSHKAYLTYNQRWVPMARQYKTESVGLWSREDYPQISVQSQNREQPISAARGSREGKTQYPETFHSH